MSHYKPYPVYKDSGVEWIGEVPEHWEVKRMRHAAAFTNSNVDKKSYSGQDYITLCNYTDVYYNEFITSKIPFMPATASRDEITKFSLRKGDVLITKDSEAPDDIGIPSIVSEDVPGVICGYHLTLIRSSDLATARILHRVLQSHPTKAHFFVEAPGITRYGLSQDAIGDLRVCLPPPEERDAIADWIDRQTARIDALITKKTRFIELLKEKRQALITHAVTKGLDPNVKMKDSGVEWIGEVPEHWEVTRIKWLTKLRIDRRNDSPEGYHYIGLEDIEPETGKLKPTENNSRQSEESNVAVFFCGDVLYGKLRPYLKKAIISEQEGICSTEFLIIRPVSVSPRWLQHWLLTSEVTQQIEAGCFGAKMPRTDWEHVSSIFMPIPDSTEQATIISALDQQTARIDLIIEKTQRSIDLLRERRSALITAAVTGKIDIRGSL